MVREGRYSKKYFSSIINAPYGREGGKWLLALAPFSISILLNLPLSFSFPPLYSFSSILSSCPLIKTLQLWNWFSDISSLNPSACNVKTNNQRAVMEIRLMSDASIAVLKCNSLPFKEFMIGSWQTNPWTNIQPTNRRTCRFMGSYTYTISFYQGSASSNRGKLEIRVSTITWFASRPLNRHSRLEPTITRDYSKFERTDYYSRKSNREHYTKELLSLALDRKSTDWWRATSVFFGRYTYICLLKVEMSFFEKKTSCRCVYMIKNWKPYKIF